MNYIIIATGGRLNQFKQCIKYLNAQEGISGDWNVIVVCDIISEYAAHYEVTSELDARFSSLVVRGEQEWKEGVNTQSSNLKTAIVIISETLNVTDNLLIIEDDDYYAPNYLSTMQSKLDNGIEFIGTSNSLYYHTISKKFKRHNNQHASLFQTGFKASHINTFLNSLDEKFIDLKFSEKMKQKGISIYLMPEFPILSVGIKGLPGKEGIGRGHDSAYYRKDYQNAPLKKELERVYG